MVAVVAQPLDLVDLEAGQQELPRVRLEPVELDKLLDLPPEHFLVFLGAVEELRWHGLGPTHVLLPASGFTSGATILAHLLVLVLINFELICHAVVDHASW